MVNPHVGLDHLSDRGNWGRGIIYHVLLNLCCVFLIKFEDPLRHKRGADCDTSDLSAEQEALTLVEERICDDSSVEVASEVEFYFASNFDISGQ